MSKIKCLLTLFLFLYPAFIYSQEAHIILQADTAISVKLYGEIDNAINRSYPVDTIRLTPGKPICHQVKVTNFMYVQLRYSSGVQCTLLLFPGNEVTVSYSGQVVRIAGDNSAGQLFFNQHFQTGLIAYVKKYMDSWKKYTRHEIGYETLMEVMRGDTMLLHERIEHLEALVAKRQVTSQFADTLIENIHLFKQAYYIQSLRTLLLSDKFKEKMRGDSLIITNGIDSLFSRFPSQSPQFITRVSKQSHGVNYLVQYFHHHFKNDQTDEDPRLFYHLSPTLHAPEELRPALIGRELTASIAYGMGQHLKENCAYFIERYPDSEYVPILKEYLKELETSSEISIIQIDSISTLSDFAAVEQLKGKYVLVDLWATWCIPCRQEFAYRQELDELLKSFNDLVLVYVSLSWGSNQQKWLEVIRKYKLAGIHTIASEELQEDIREKIFNGTRDNVLLPTEFTVKGNEIEGNSITIPRYFLLDKEGKVICHDLPRPSNMGHLKETLEKIFTDIK